MSRPVTVILEDWRAAERELGEASDDALREAIEARIASLAAEHQVAIGDRQHEAVTLGVAPRPTHE